MGAKEFFNKLIGIEEDPEAIEITQEEIDRERERMTKSSNITEPAGNASTGSNRSAFNEVAPPMDHTQNDPLAERRMASNHSGQFRLLVIEPKSLDECRKLVDNLRAHKPVIINLERVETDLARKMFDFLGGATYALSGNVQRVTQNIFIFAPNNVNINAKLDRTTEASPEESTSPWR